MARRASTGSDRTGVSATSAERFVRRARGRRLLALRPVLATLAVLGVAGGAVWALYFSDLLVVRDVRVGGVARVSVAEVREAASVVPGTPLARVDVDAAARAVERLRAVEDVDVRRAWPHTLRVDVTEREPAVVVPTSGAYLLVDDRGVAFEEVGRRPAGVPVLRTDVVSRSRPVTLRAALHVLADVPDEVRSRVRQVRAPTWDDVTLHLSGDVRVVWGSPQRGAEKARVLRALLERRGRVYDVSAPDAPAVRGVSRAG
jgi:cell division protein FtsQ